MTLKMRFLRLPVFVLTALAAVASVASGEVTRVDVTSRKAIGTSGYEKIVGTAHFAVNPKDPHNRVIADIDKAPVNGNGQVEFSGDVVILRPLDAAKANGVALIDVVNRGRKTIMTTFNRGAAADPESDADLGDAFLTRQGYTLVFVAWEFDVARQASSMRLEIPAAQGVAGFVHGDFTPNDAKPEQSVTDLTGYLPADDAAADTTLTVRDGPFGRPETVARNRFTVKGNTVTLTGGFAAGRTYQLSYRPQQFPVSGLGMAAFRDVATWVKRSPDALVKVPKTIAWGSSQSGRFLRTFLYYGFNSDEKNQQVFDGVMAHIAGGARLSLNLRGAEPTALTMYEIATFPFAPNAQRDPISGVTEGLLENERARATQPKVFFTNTSVEYWGGGRSAALIHTTADGKSDVQLPDNVRAFFLTGSQHGPARFPTKVNQGQQPDNPLEYAYTLRALLVAMTRWVKDGSEPPASRIPRLADGTLVPINQVRFPEIAGVQNPRTIPVARQAGQPLPFLVPQVGDDGNELSGVRTAEQVVPMATYTGWNFRNQSIGGTSYLVNLLGAAIPLPRTKSEREATHDPRKSVEERYASRDAYLASARQVADALVRDRLLLADDVAQVMKRIEEQWTAASTTATQ
jgi:alpha/beta hydrolase family protein